MCMSVWLVSPEAQLDHIWIKLFTAPFIKSGVHNWKDEEIKSHRFLEDEAWSITKSSIILLTQPVLKAQHVYLIDGLVNPECSFSIETHLGTKLASIFLVFPTYLEDRRLND